MAAGGGGRPPGSDSSLEPYVQTRIFKIIVIGDSNVGKTCLTFRFCGGTFPDKTEATIGVDFREKTVEIEGERIKVGHGGTGTGPKAAGPCPGLGFAPKPQGLFHSQPSWREGAGEASCRAEGPS